MELSPDMIEHLRDEAYVLLCRQAIVQALEGLEQEKSSIASTRPPFGVLARKETRDAFSRSMRTALDGEAALRSRLDQVAQLEHWLQRILEPELRAYLLVAAPEFQRFSSARELLNQWATTFSALPELVLAFARDVGNIRQNATSPHPRRDLQLFAVLRDTALRVEEQLVQLDGINRQLTATVPVIARTEVRAPALPELRRVGWVNTIALLPVGQLGTVTIAVENAARQFVTQGRQETLARLQASHDACTGYEEAYLQRYWNQLRTHAQTHYVEERDIDEVIATLAQRYVTSDLARRQLALAADPFLGER
jgi:hypothetical protein